MADSRIDELRRRLARDPGSRLFAQLAEELRKAGEFEEAIGVARAGLAQHPSYPSARLTLGRALLDSGDPRAARVELEAAAKGAPDNILANRMLGEALESLGDLRAALAQYKTTLSVAPEDRNVEAKIQAIETSLKSAGGGSGGGPPGPAEAKSPAATARPLPPERRPEPKGEAAVGEDEEATGGEVAPTIRIRARGERPLPPSGAGVGRGVPARSESSPRQVAPPGASADRPGASPPPPASGGPVPQTPAEATPSAAGDGDAATGRGGGARGAPHGGGEQPADRGTGASEPGPPETTLPIGTRPAPGEGAEAARGAVGEGTAARPSLEEEAEAAPTIPPTDHPVEEPDEALAPTLPPRQVDEVAGARENGAGGREQSTAVGGTEDAGGSGPVEAPPAEPTARAAARPEFISPEPPEPLPKELADARATAGPEAPRPGAVGSEAPASPLSSVTLAELYFQQGLLERAVEVYRQVLDEEPGNARARLRLDEVEALVAAGSAELAVPAAAAGDDREARRRALERTIERLEDLLAVVRRR